MLKFINEFNKVAWYKINIQKFVVFLYTKNKLSEREMKEKIPFTTASKRKHLGINLTKKVKDLYTDNYKMLLTGIKKDLKNKHIVLPDWRTQYYEDSRYPQTHLWLQGNPIKDSPAFWLEIDKLHFKFTWKGKETKIAEMILQKKNKFQDSHYLFEDFLQSYSFSVELVMG